MRQMILVMFLLGPASCRTSDRQESGSTLRDVADVTGALATLTADGTLDVADVDRLFASAGANLNASEGLAIWKAVRQPQGYVIPSEAVAAAEARAMMLGLPQDHQDLLSAGQSLAGTAVPEAVRKVLVEARLAGAVAYDVRDPDPDDPNEGYWSPYPQGIPARESMAWSYTEITPQKLHADLDATSEEDRIAGQDPAGAEVTYVRDSCQGQRGAITAEYDELFHPNIYARGRRCQKWANNCAILFDGTLHCLPASRRAATTGPLADLILTNPSLARERLMLWNGHLEARNGVITSVGTSGRLGKYAARNRHAFADPVALLKAWGFNLAPDLKTHSEHGGTAGQFRTHELSATLRGAE